MLRGLVFILIFSFGLSACGGARSNHPDVTISNTSFITWEAPTSYIDQTPLSMSEIGGYYIYLGTNINNMRLVSDINDPTKTEYSLSHLRRGIYYIAIACYDINGLDSGFSSVIVVKLI